MRQMMRVAKAYQKTGKEEHMKSLRGFTLLELLMVVVVIAILAAVALPQFLKTQERARMSEALTILGAIRSAEIRYYAENSTYTNTTTALDLGTAATDLAGTPAYAYTVSGATATDFVAVATRTGLTTAPPGCGSSAYTVRLSRAGTRCGTDCQTTAATCTP